MNKMPEVAKMLGVEIGEEFMVSGGLEDGVHHRISENGFERKHNGCWNVHSLEHLGSLVAGRIEIRPLPHYTIPENTPVDAKVWVRDGKDEPWQPWHWARYAKDLNYPLYAVWTDGGTSHSLGANGNLAVPMGDNIVYFDYCITDEDYQKRKKEGTL